MRFSLPLNGKASKSENAKKIATHHGKSFKEKNLNSGISDTMI